MEFKHLSGLIAAGHTPFDAEGELNLDVIPQIVEHLITSGLSAIYAVGSTGEGVSLKAPERMAVAEAYVNASAGRLPIIVQVGSNSLAESCDLAVHAADCGAYAVSATSPSYFKVATASGLVDAMAQIASAAPDLPFYHYHIPRFTGSRIDMLEFLDQGGRAIPNLAGLKYTDMKVHEYQSCLNFDSGRFDILWGCDEMLLSALAVGARCGVGSTYNIAGPLYRRIVDSYESGDIESARKWQLCSVKMIRVLIAHDLDPSLKAVMEMLGVNVGGCRLPLGALDEDGKENLRKDLDAIGFFEWSKNG